MVIVAAEMLSGDSGSASSWNSLQRRQPGCRGAIVLIGIVGVILDTLFVYAGKRYSGEAHR
jgi:ABC-type nitrate/sulfonate/bicarbonate transport system permease component